MSSTHNIPVVMTLAGNDPTGGAGIQADIEALASMGCHAAPVITALTIQDTNRVHRFDPVEPSVIIEQARAVLEDIPVAVFKIGMIGSTENVEAIHSILIDYPDIPVVLDPVLAGGGGGKLADADVIDAIISMLLPQTTILTPNTEEARRLATTADTLDACAQELLDMGCEFVLLTGTHENTGTVDNSLYAERRRLETFSWERLPGSYHGSGCTLAATVAGLLAQGLDPFNAVHEAQQYTWESLKNGYHIGMGQTLPNRLFWARDEEAED